VSFRVLLDGDDGRSGDVYMCLVFPEVLRVCSLSCMGTSRRLRAACAPGTGMGSVRAGRAWGFPSGVLESGQAGPLVAVEPRHGVLQREPVAGRPEPRSEEHTSELQSRENIVF